MDIPTYGKNPEIAREERFEVGDIVKIRCREEMEFLLNEDVNGKTRGTVVFLIPDMIKHAGETRRVVRVRKLKYRKGETLYRLEGIKEDVEWDNYMLEHVGTKKEEDESKTYEIPDFFNSPDLSKKKIFKPGDIVTICSKEELESLEKPTGGLDEYGREKRGSSYHINEDMMALHGKKAKILKVEVNDYFGKEVVYKIDLDRKSWNWTCYMFEETRYKFGFKKIPNWVDNGELASKILFKVGDTVEICSKKELKFLDEKCRTPFGVDDEMMDCFCKKAKIVKISQFDKSSPVNYSIEFEDGKKSPWSWSCYMFKETRYLEQKQWDKGDKDKKEKSGTEKKRQVKRVEKKEPEIKTVLIEPVHVKEISVYDYQNQKSHFEIPEGKYITKIEVTVVTGDETGLVFFSDGSVMQFDSCDYRTYNYFDGSYTVTADNLEKWMNFSPNDFDRKSKNFSVQRMKFAATLL